MTAALARLRSDLPSRAAALSLVSNAGLLVLKLVVAMITGSVAILSDAIDSGEDVLASSFALLGVRLSAQPADEEHPYGHGKAESLAAIGQGILISAGAGFVAFQAIRRLIEPQEEIGVGLGLGAMGVSAVVNLLVVLYVVRAARLTGSVALASDARHLWTNVVQAGTVMAALILVALTGQTLFDPVAALLLSAFLLWTAFRVFRLGMGETMDVRLPGSELEVIEACILKHSAQVRGYHHLRTRKSGRQRYIDFHMVVDPRMSVGETHEICDRIEEDLRQQLPGSVVTIHVEPDDGRPVEPFHRGPMRMGGGQREQPS